MDVFSVAANAVSIAGAASPLVRRGAVERAVHDCFSRALRAGLAEQGRDDRGASASLVADALSPKRAHDLLARYDAQLADRDRAEKWSLALGKVIPALGVLDERAVDIPRLAKETARQFGLEIDRAARQPGSVLAVPLLLARSAPPVPDPDPDATAATVSFARTASGAVSNLATLPLSEHSVPRPEQDAVAEAIAGQGMAVLSGGPGAGKTVLAEMTARSWSVHEDIELVWWVKAKTPQHLMDACEGLLLEFGEQPTGDPQSQVRSLLARRGGWLVVVDDATEFETVRQMIPAEHANGAVLVTTRSAASFPKAAVVQLDAADEATLREIARRRLPDEISESEVSELLGACAGNPLIVFTACAYLADTGTSVASLVALMRSSPSRVLAGRPDSAGFVGVLDGIRVDARSALAWPLLVAVAVSGGGGVPRRLLETTFADGLDAEIRIDEAFRELMSLGVVGIRSSIVESHALTASVVLDLAEPSLRAASAERVMVAVQDLVEIPGRRLLPGLATVVDAADAVVDEQEPARVMARILLAERLAEQGLIHSAYRQVDAARAVPYVGGVRAAQLAIMQSEARVRLLAGESKQAKQAAESVVADPTAAAELRAAALVTISWAADALGDRATTQRSIAEALILMPDDAGVQSLHDHFFLLDAPASERVARYLDLAERTTDEMRGYFWTMASRSSIHADRPNDAVELAQRAVEADRTVGGDHNLNVARDLNDLGMALIADGQLEKASEALHDSIAIYEEDQESHSHMALPLLHLGRVLTQRAQQTRPPDAGLLAQARETLDQAIVLQRQAAPGSDDHASLLYASGDVLLLSGDAARALESYREAAQIDRAVHGETHREVGVDIARMMHAHLELNDVDGALRTFGSVKAQVPEWERDDPNLALRLLCMQAEALLALPAERVLQKAELTSVVSRIRVLSRQSNIVDDHRALARDIVHRHTAG